VWVRERKRVCASSSIAIRSTAARPCSLFAFRIRAKSATIYHHPPRPYALSRFSARPLGRSDPHGAAVASAAPVLPPLRPIVRAGEGALLPTLGNYSSCMNPAAITPRRAPRPCCSSSYQTHR
jgi:hypothetical protein